MTRDPYTLLEGDVIECLQSMPDASVQCVVTSPPYWGLRNYGVEGAGGLEPTLQEHLAWLVDVFREVRRVLRDDGVVFCNYGDCYASARIEAGGSHGGWNGSSDEPQKCASGKNATISLGGLAPKQRLLMPARVALALRDDGWWIRSEIVWAKGVSFCPTYSGSCMPSPVRDRPTDSHEMVYLLTKKANYFYDSDAVREDAKYAGAKISLGPKSMSKRQATGAGVAASGNALKDSYTVAPGRNLRTVWTIGTQAMKEAHFATFPEALVKPCILAGTSEHGACSECGAPWERVVEREQIAKCRNVSPIKALGEKAAVGASKWTAATEEQTRVRVTTTGWEPTCSHPDASVVPCVVLDPFSGSGTTGVVALRHGRDYVGCELNPEYCDMQEARLEAEQAALRWADGIIFDGKRFLNGAQPITQKALRAATKKQGISGRRFRELLDDARADYAPPPAADAGGGGA